MNVPQRKKSDVKLAGGRDNIGKKFEYAAKTDTSLKPYKKVYILNLKNHRNEVKCNFGPA